jgi:hypothetical protein
VLLLLLLLLLLLAVGDLVEWRRMVLVGAKI